MVCQNTMWHFYYVYLDAKGQSRVHKTVHQNLQKRQNFELSDIYGPRNDILLQFACRRKGRFSLQKTLKTTSKSTKKGQKYIAL